MRLNPMVATKMRFLSRVHSHLDETGEYYAKQDKSEGEENTK